jgi:glutathione S-transferase
MAASRHSLTAVFRQVLSPARATLKAQPFLSGAMPAYADYALFSVFQWARLCSGFDPIEPSDAITAWRERMLDLFEGLPRASAFGE